MSSIFDAYDAEFSDLASQISRAISDITTYETDAAKATSIVRQVEALIRQADDLIKQMEIEVRSQDPATRKDSTNKVTHFKRTLQQLKTDFTRSKDASERHDLFAGTASHEQRQRLLDTNQKLERQNDAITNARRTVEETTEVALEITGELARNREKIQSTSAKVSEFHGDMNRADKIVTDMSKRECVNEFTGMTDSARRLLHSMGRREIQQKMILSFIALVLLAGIVVTIYYTV